MARYLAGFFLLLLSIAGVATGQNDNTQGIQGAYFNNKELSGTAVLRNDSNVDFHWGRTSPHPEIGVDDFSVRWIGQIEPQYTENYTFYTSADDGVKLWINRQLIVDDWSDHGERESSGTIFLEAGFRYDIQVEYYENGGDASVQILWSSKSQPKQVIPHELLYQGDFENAAQSLPTFTPSATLTPRPTNTPTATYTSSPTYTPTPTQTPSPTFTPTPMTYRITGSTGINARSCPQRSCEIVVVISASQQLSVSQTVEGDSVSGNTTWLVSDYQGTPVYVHSSLAVQVVPPTPTRSVNTSSSTTYYVSSTGRVNIRSCASTDCSIVGTANRGDRLRVVDTQADWHIVLLSDSSIGYISTSLTSRNPPPTLAPIQQSQSQPPPPPISAPPQTGGSCPSLSATCGQLASCEQARACLAAGNSSLDRDHDGIPCESICGG